MDVETLCEDPSSGVRDASMELLALMHQHGAIENAAYYEMLSARILVFPRQSLNIDSVGHWRFCAQTSTEALEGYFSSLKRESSGDCWNVDETLGRQ